MRSRTLPVLFLLTALASPVVAVPDPPNWYTKADEATKEARRSGRPILVDLYAAWCGWCKELDRNVFSTPRFQQFARDFVLLRVDTEDRGEGTELNDRYQVQSLPTTLLLDGDHILLGKIEGYAPTEEYIGEIQQELEEFAAYEARAKAAIAGADLNEQKGVAAEAHLRGDGKRAAALYRKLAASGDVPSPVAGALQYMLADALRLSKDWEGAAVALERARAEAQKIHDADLLERTEMLATNVAQESGDCKGAKDRLERFLIEHPKSGLASEAKRALRAIETDKSAQCT
jgi:thioredoxin-related protein